MMPTRRSGRSRFAPASTFTTVRRSMPSAWSECRESAQAGCTAIRSEPGRRDASRDADTGFGPQDRRHDVELTTKEPDSFLPINLTNLSWRACEMAEAVRRRRRRDAKAKSQAAWAGVPAGRESRFRTATRSSHWTTCLRARIAAAALLVEHFGKARLFSHKSHPILAFFRQSDEPLPRGRGSAAIFHGPVPERYARTRPSGLRFRLGIRAFCASNSFCHFAGLAMNSW